jgi:hypothetical protein
MLFSYSLNKRLTLRAELFYSGKELICADHELVFVALQHDGRFPRSKRRPPLNSIGVSSKDDLLPGTILL